MEAILAGLFGLLIGSFLNVCIYRLPRDLSVVAPRSFCPACERGIAWYDNVPLLSFLILRGRCRHCGARISWRYPFVELATGILFFAAVRALGAGLPAVKLCALGAILIVLVVSDLEERILPDEFTLGGVALGIVFAALIPFQTSLWAFIFPGIASARAISVLESVFAAALSSGTLWAVGALYEKLRHRDGLGFGDVKMVAMIGAFLGLQGVLLTLIVGSALGAVTGLLYILITRKDASTYQLPFGTFLGLAALGVAVYGEVLERLWLGT